MVKCLHEPCMTLQWYVCFGIMLCDKEMIKMSYDPKADKKYNAKSNYTGVFHIKLFECGCSIEYYVI